MAGIDANTKLYLKFAEGADEATDCSDFSPSGHNPTFVGTAKLDSAQKLSSGGYSVDVTSLLLDGNSDYVQISDSSDWDLIADTSNYTIDGWVYSPSISTNMCFLSQGDAGANTYWYFGHNTTYGFYLISGNSGAVIDTRSENRPILSPSAWTHVALCKVGTKYGIYMDGAIKNYTDDSSTANFSSTLQIGARKNLSGYDLYWNGNMAHVRIQKYNIFSANPDSGLTDTITVPTAPYSADASSFKSKIIMY